MTLFIYSSVTSLFLFLPGLIQMLCPVLLAFRWQVKPCFSMSNQSALGPFNWFTLPMDFCATFCCSGALGFHSSHKHFFEALPHTKETSLGIGLGEHLWFPRMAIITCHSMVASIMEIHFLVVLETKNLKLRH